ncbi:Synapse differentiation-inducing protein 1 [Biomphalaria pfeifferi]|uniref:Synapse differentiation-inducing protein 1 n=1 Tax=Biomphalaria pfeifferi TaxID=112525 RepID=A0AAD8B6W4_BIOPF|nr:Synapse differentiation-inducing protein 1 [Biomphalaria pfeifferi]
MSQVLGPHRNEDHEMLVPPEDQRRTIWSTENSSGPVPTVNDEPLLNAGYPQPTSTGYPKQTTVTYPNQTSVGSSWLNPPGYYQSLPAGHPQQSSANSVVVVQPGTSTTPVYNTGHATDYTVFSIFVTLCCCPPMGICALIDARDSKAHLLLGNTQKAQDLARKSRNWNIAGLTIGVVTLAALIIFLTIFLVNSTHHAWSSDGAYNGWHYPGPWGTRGPYDTPGPDDTRGPDDTPGPWDTRAPDDTPGPWDTRAPWK